MKQVIQTDKAPKAIGSYSQAICAGNTVYLSGQIGLVCRDGDEPRREKARIWTSLCHASYADSWIARAALEIRGVRGGFLRIRDHRPKVPKRRF